MRVLIAEDGAMERLLAQSTVETLGHECIVAEDGARAWALFQEQGADVLLSDWLMPGLSGPELCRRVRAEAGPNYTYLILLTKLDDKKHTLFGMRAGADDYLTKPLHIDDLEVCLTAAERVTEMHRQLAHREASREATLERRDALLRLAGRVAAEDDSERLVRQLLTESVVLVGGTAGMLSRWDGDQRALIPVASTIATDADDAWVALSHTASTQAAERRSSVVLSDVSREHHPLAGVASPLLHDGRLLGTISVVAAASSKRFSTEDTDVLEQLATVGAATLVRLDRARLSGAALAMRSLQPAHPTHTGRTTGPTPRHNLPPQPISLIGRAAEVQAVRDLLLRSDVRLVTLTGPAGVGKTRLALAAAAGLVDTFEHGLVFVDLAPVEDAAMVMPTVAQALGIQERPAFEAFGRALTGQRLLLLLDNFEHVAGAAAEVLELLTACLSLTVLVTSRSALRLAWERQIPVLPLAVPSLTGSLDLESVARAPAVALFVERARAVQRNFSLTRDNVEAVAQMCARLDGLPLAIELAAARIHVLPVSALSSRMDRSLRVLIDGARDLPERHRTLRNAIAWSHALLTANEQRVFRRLAVFEGGVTLEAAAMVCDESDATDPSWETLEELGRLLARSLLYRELQSDGQPRFRLLETIREYAREQLVDSGELEGMQARHGAFFLALAERADLFGRGQEAWLHCLEREHDNLRAALRRSVESGDVQSELRLAGALARFWNMRGHLAEGHTRLMDALARGDGAPATLRAKVLFGAAALTAARSDWAAAEVLFEASLDLYRQLGDRRGTAMSLGHLASVHLRRGATATARERGHASLALARELDDASAVVHCLQHLAEIAIARGEYRVGRAQYEESLSLARAIGDSWRVAAVLEGLGAVASEQGRSRGALRLAGAAAAVRAGLGTPLSSVEQGLVEQWQTRARATLDEETAATAWSDGYTMPADQVARDAFRAEDPASAAVGRAAESEEFRRITPRERQVAVLVARGLRNRQIGDALGLTERTVEVHVSNILNKLAFSSRAQLAVWATEHSLTASSGSRSTGIVRAGLS